MVCVIMAVAGCATPVRVPRAGSGTVEVTEGGLVETLIFDSGHTLNLQVTELDVPVGKALFPHVLAIGKFSEVLGSGFTKRANIYYESRIGGRGNDAFAVDGISYSVSWWSRDIIRLDEPDISVFTVTVEIKGALPASDPE
jgi:hypothetical protein